MEVKVNIAGNEIEVSVTPEQEAELQKKYETQFMANFFRETTREIRQNHDFTADETAQLVDELFHAYPNLQELCEVIIEDTYFKQVKDLADGIVKERAKVYRVTVSYSGEFDILVKARSKDEAEKFVNSLSDYDLAQCVDAVDAEFEVDYIAEDDSIEEWAVDFDAME